MVDSFRPDTPAVAIDFETYYDAECSVSQSSYWAYTHHPLFDAYLVSIHGEGISYVGHPRNAPWEELSGMLWLSHNRPFDEHVYMRIVEQGIAPLVKCHAWCDTADLCRYLKYPASLGQAAPLMIGMSLDKGVREDMKGTVFADLDDETRERWIRYADQDAIACYRIWDQYRDQWPRAEMLLSMHTAECVKRGVYVDRDRVELALEALPRALARIEARIPWAGEPLLTPSGKQRMKGGQPQTKSPTSSIWFGRYCESLGLPAPSSTAVKDGDWQDWSAEYGSTAAGDVAVAIQQWRQVNRTLRIAEQVRDRIRDDGRMEFCLMYFGARNTGRWSGKRGEWEDDNTSTNLNMLNLPREHLYLDSNYDVATRDTAAHDIYVRSFFCAPQGRQLIACDLAQIEPRVLAYIVEDKDYLEYMRKGMDPYEAYARTHLGYSDSRPLKDVDPGLRQQAKVAVLQLGYQSGAAKLRDTARLVYGMDLSMDEAERMVRAYRHSNKGVVKFWAECQGVIERVCSKAARTRGTLVDVLIQPSDFDVELDSGRHLSYFGLCRRHGEYLAASSRGGKVGKLYGGKLVENVVQAESRDVFADGILRLEAAGFEVIFHVYDEYVIEAHPSIDPQEVVDIVTEPPEWAATLPVAAEADAMTHYRK